MLILAILEIILVGTMLALLVLLGLEIWNFYCDFKGKHKDKK